MLYDKSRIEKMKKKKKWRNNSTHLRVTFLKKPRSGIMINLLVLYGQSPLIFIASTTLLTANTVLALRMLTPYFSDV
jgi:hypothetical protein